MKNKWIYGVVFLLIVWIIISFMFGMGIEEVLFWIGILFIGLSGVFGFLSGKVHEKNKIKKTLVIGCSGSGKANFHIKPNILKSDEAQ